MRQIQGVYISVPMQVDSSKVSEVAKFIKSLNQMIKVTAWKKVLFYYKEELFKGIDTMVVILPDLAWKKKRIEITTGVNSEIQYCMERQIPMFLAYWANDGLHIYSTTRSDDTFSGVAGTHRNFEELCKGTFNKSNKDSEDFIKKIWYGEPPNHNDRELMLLL